MIKEKTICSQCTLRIVKTNEIIEVKAPEVLYECNQESTDNGLLETETITITCPSYRQDDKIFDCHTRYIATLNLHRVIGTPRYPLIKSMSHSGTKATITFKCIHPVV